MTDPADMPPSLDDILPDDGLEQSPVMEPPKVTTDLEAPLEAEAPPEGAEDGPITESDPASPPPMRVVRTAITEADVAAITGGTGRADHVFIVEAPESLADDEITAEAIAVGAVSALMRVPLVPVESTPPPPEPEPEPIAVLEEKTPEEPPAPKKPTKIVRTMITDAAHNEAIRALGGRADAGYHDHVLTVEMPEDADEADLTADRIAQDPEINVVSRTRVSATPATEPSEGLTLIPSSLTEAEPADPRAAIFIAMENAHSMMRAAAARLKELGGAHDKIVSFQIETLGRRLSEQMKYLAERS